MIVFKSVTVGLLLSIFYRLHGIILNPIQLIIGVLVVCIIDKVLEIWETEK